MCEIDTIQHGYFYQNIGTFCQGCLSTDRKLSMIVGDYIDIFRNISNKSRNISQLVFLCWECMALLKKIKCFRSRIEEAQRILANHFVNNQKSVLKTLSKLTKIYIDNTIIITHKNDARIGDAHLDIKHENISDNELNDDVPTNFLSLVEEKQNKIKLNAENTKVLCLEKIKKENATLPKALKKNRKHYRIEIENRNKVLRKKIPIKPEDVNKWRERESESEFYNSFKHQCDMCIRGFEAEEKLGAHILKYHDESSGPHICTTCNKRFTAETSLNRHIQLHLRAWQCARCDFQSYTLQHLNAHISTHSRIQCVYCDAQFSTVSTFFSHYKSLHRSFICDHCGKRSSSKHILEKHMMVHIETHKCSACPNTYKSRRALRKHYYIKHSENRAENSYCVLCNKQYVTVDLYRRHVQSSAAHAHERDVEASKKFPCPECSNTYSRRTYMMNHYRHVHMNQSKHYCSQCDRHFLNRTRYLDHVRYSHEGVKKDKNKLCNICGKGFATNRTLVNHIRTHSGERPYECEYCSAKFTQKTSMLSHVKYIHMKNKRRPQWQH